MKISQRRKSDGITTVQQTVIEFGADEFPAFCAFVARAGGSSDVFIAPPGAAPSRYIGALAEGTEVVIEPWFEYGYMVTGRTTLSRDALASLAMAGVSPNDWGPLGSDFATFAQEQRRALQATKEPLEALVAGL